MKLHRTLKTLLLIFILAIASAQNAFAIEGGYKDGLYVQTEDGLNSLKTNIHLQVQHQFLSVEGQGDTNSFQVRRARLFFSGNALVPRLTYLINFEMVGGQTNNVSEGVNFTGPNLRDAYLNYDFNKGIQIRAGQFKVPFNLEELISDPKSQFVDRAITNDAFSFNRDLGVNVHGRIFDKKFEYNLFAMNEGTNQNIANNNNEMIFGTRLAFNWLGDHGYTSSDVDNSEKPQLMTGVAGNFNRVGAPAAPDESVISGTGDIAFRYRGFSIIGAGYYLRNHTDSTNTYGFLGQTGFFIIPKHLEIMGRFAGVVPTDSGVTNGYESSGGMAYYFLGHKLKIISDYSILWNSPLVLQGGASGGTNNLANIATTGGVPGFRQNQNDHRVRTQVQLFF